MSHISGGWIHFCGDTVGLDFFFFHMDVSAISKAYLPLSYIYNTLA